MEKYAFFSVCVFNERDQIYQRKEFEDLDSALDYAYDLCEKYSIRDEIIVYNNAVNSLWIQKGKK